MRKVIGRVVGFALVIAILMGCRTRNYALLQQSYPFELESPALVLGLVDSAVSDSGWEVVDSGPGYMQASRSDGPYSLCADIRFSKIEFTMDLVSDSDLRLDRKNHIVHKLGFKWACELRDALVGKIENIVRSGGEMVYSPMNKPVSLDPGRDMAQVVKSSCLCNGLKISLEEPRTTIAVVGDCGFQLRIDFTDIDYSISQFEKDGGKTTTSRYNALVRKIEKDIQRYGSPVLWEQSQESRRRHQDDVRRNQELNRVRRAVLFGF